MHVMITNFEDHDRSRYEFSFLVSHEIMQENALHNFKSIIRFQKKISSLNIKESKY